MAQVDSLSANGSLLSVLSSADYNSEQHDDVEGPSPLLGLPPEIRNIIYELVLAGLNESLTRTKAGAIFRQGQGPALLRTSKVIRSEILPLYLYRNIHCHVRLDGFPRQAAWLDGLLAKHKNARFVIGRFIVDASSQFKWELVPLILPIVQLFAAGRIDLYVSSLMRRKTLPRGPPMA